jgi:hypothetical protein
MALQVGHCEYTIWISTPVDIGSSSRVQNAFKSFPGLALSVLKDCCFRRLPSHFPRGDANRRSKVWSGVTYYPVDNGLRWMDR